MDALAAVPITVEDGRSSIVQAGGFDFGVQECRGPLAENAFVLALTGALHNIGNLEAIANPRNAAAVTLEGHVLFGGGVTIGGLSRTVPAQPEPAGSMVSVLVESSLHL